MNARCVIDAPYDCRHIAEAAERVRRAKGKEVTEGNLGFPLFVYWGAASPVGCRAYARCRDQGDQRIPGNIPFIERIILAMPPLAIIFMSFCACSN